VVFVAVLVVPVPVAVVCVVVDAADVAGAATPPLSSPAFVTRKVTARTRTPKTAMIAGRGSSIRVAVGTNPDRTQFC
jgi:hypothetical protein